MELLPGFLARNWQLKLAAFAIAMLLWVVVRLDSANRQSIPARVLIENTDPDWALVGEPLPGVVEVIFGGPAGAILRVAVAGTSVRVPIDEVAVPDTSIGLRSEWVSVDGVSGLVVQDIRPASVRLHFEPIKTEEKPLAIRTRNTLPHSLAFTQPLSVMPTTVRLRGPESRVAGIDTIYMEPLDLEEVRESGTFVLPVSKSALSDMIVSVDSATLRVQVEPSEERSVKLPVSGSDPSLEISPDSVDVRLFGARSRVDAMQEQNLRAVLRGEDLANLEPGEERTVQIRLEGVPDLVQAIPSESSVVVRRSTER